MIAVEVRRTYVATASVPVTFEKPPGKITYQRCQVLQMSPMTMLADNAPNRTCSRGCPNPRQPSSSAKSEPKMTKYKPPGPENDGETIQCAGSVPRCNAVNASATQSRMMGPISPSPYQTTGTRQTRIWRETERTPPAPGYSPATR